MRWGLSVREQRTVLLGGALAALVGWLYLAYVTGPLMREAANLGRQAQSAREQLKVLETVTANETALRAQHRQVQETVASLRRLLPSEEELPAVIERLSDLASQSQVKIQTIFPQRSSGSAEAAGGARGAEPEAVVYKEVLIQIDALAGYHQLGTFVSLVEAEDKPMRIASLQISGDSKEAKRHRVKLLLRSYFATTGAVSIGEGPVAQAPRPLR